MQLVREKHKFVFIRVHEWLEMDSDMRFEVRLQLSPEQDEALDARLLCASPAKARAWHA